MHEVSTTRISPTQTRDVDLALALEHHAADRLDEAGPIYQRLYAADRRDSEVIYLLGLLCCDLGLFEAACKLLQEALAIAPRFPEARSQMAVALNGLADQEALAGKLGEVQGSSERALDIPLLTHTYSHFGAECEQHWLLNNRKINHSSPFLETGFYLEEITLVQADALRAFLAPAIATPFAEIDALPGYLSSSLGDEMVTSLNRECIYYGRPPESAIHALEAIVARMAPELESQMGQSWSVVNVRAWSVRPGASAGPNAWHMDGFSHYVRKLMFYLNAPCPENGTIEIATRKGAVVIVDAAKPACILLDSAVLAHRGRPAPDKDRPMIELTLIPAMRTSTKCIWAGQNARVPLRIEGAEHIERRLRRLRCGGPTAGTAHA